MGVNPNISISAISAFSAHRYTRGMGKYSYRIREIREAAGLTQAQVADAIGLHLTNYNALENGKTRLTPDRMEQIGRALGVNPIELLADPAGRSANFRTVIVKGHVQAGHWAESSEWPEEDWFGVPILDDPALSNYTLHGAQTRGPSMDRRYPEGTILIFTDINETGEEPQLGKRYIVERERPDGMRETTVKQLWRDENGDVWLLPDSTDPRFQTPIAIDGDESATIRIVGRVIGTFQRE